MHARKSASRFPLFPSGASLVQAPRAIFPFLTLLPVTLSAIVSPFRLAAPEVIRSSVSFLFPTILRVFMEQILLHNRSRPVPAARSFPENSTATLRSERGSRLSRGAITLPTTGETYQLPAERSSQLSDPIYARRIFHPS